MLVIRSEPTEEIIASNFPSDFMEYPDWNNLWKAAVKSDGEIGHRYFH